jgi:aspartate aminotransferase/aminotransferase
MGPHIAAYRRKRDLVVEGLKDCYELAAPGGAFYAFPQSPWGTAAQFVTEAIAKHKLLIIPGNVFSKRDTHFRISYAAADSVIERGVEVLRKMAKR